MFWSYCRNRGNNELGEPPPTQSHEWGVPSWGLVRQKQVSRTWTNNYISQVMWDVIVCPCPWYLLRAHKSYIEEGTPPEEKNHQWGNPLHLINIYMLLPRPHINDSASNFTDYLLLGQWTGSESRKAILTIFVKKLPRCRFNIQQGVLSEDVKRNLKPRDLCLELDDRFEIWQPPQQWCSRVACQISK